MQTDFLEKVAEAINGIKGQELERALEFLREDLDDGDNYHKVFIIGNGGSAALASHFASDLNKFTPLKAISLVDNTPIITAISNDLHYSQIFSKQLEKLFEPGDKLVAISSSGNSLNIVNAINLVRGENVLALTGFDGGETKKLAGYCIHIPTEKGEYELVESVHGAVLHYLIQCLKK